MALKSVSGNFRILKIQISCTLKKLHFVLLFACLSYFTAVESLGQQVVKLSLTRALEMSEVNNQSIQKSRIEKHLAEEDIKEMQELKLPEIDFHAAYARITDLTEFRHGLGDRVVTETIPVIADVTGSVTMPLYTGGMIKNSILQARQKTELASLKVEKITNDVKIEVVATFLGIYKMMELQKLIKEKIKEEEDRLKEVKAFKAHGTVTKNEVLRAELQLSDMQLTLMTNERNTAIALHHFQTILQIPDEERLDLDTTGVLTISLPNTEHAIYLEAAAQKDEIRMAHQQEQILEAQQRIIKSNYYPKFHFFASYAFNYPNYMFFPPNPYLYTLGRVGIEATFSISNLYKNKAKMHIVHQQVEMEKVATKIIQDKVNDQVFKQFMQFQDIQDKIPVTERAVRQATENYRIVRMKYLNQLALITEMIDADTALLQARFNAVSTRIDAVMKYHELQYASGLLH